MKWINLCYLFFSVVLACFILYVIIGNILNHLKNIRLNML